MDTNRTPLGLDSSVFLSKTTLYQAHNLAKEIVLHRDRIDFVLSREYQNRELVFRICAICYLHRDCGKEIAD